MTNKKAYTKGERKMKIENGKIIEATESELYSVYLQRELYELYDFHDYLKRCEDAGTKIVGKKEDEK